MAESCDKVAVMYAGEIVEYGTLKHIFHDVCHPYTKGLFGSLPSLDKDAKRLDPIEGLMPDTARLPEGCRFHPRCTNASKMCTLRAPKSTELEPGHFVRCLKYEEGGQSSA